MAGSASLVVRISADLNDFTRGLDRATKDVSRAADKVASFGKALTLGVTVPVLGAAAALAKMAAENEDTGARFERVMGGMASATQETINKLMAVVPEANTELQKMAISASNMAQGLGLSQPNAAKMSESLLKLAGDASAFAHVPMEQALDALSRGLAGKTKGLLEFGIAISEADIKQRALSMGLLHQGNALTETGTALAAYSLIMERSSRIQGEAERTAGQAGKQFQFLKRDLGELADNVSGLVLPAMSDLARKARDVVGWLGTLDQTTVKTFFNIAAAAAIIGPTIVILARMVEGVVKLRAAFALLSAGGGVIAFFGGLAALPFTTIVAGIAAITAAVGALYLAYQKLKGVKPIDLTGPLNNDPALAAAVAGSGAIGAPKANGATEIAPTVDAMKQLEDRASAVTTSLKQMANGWTIPGMTTEWFKTLSAVEAKLGTIKNAFDPIAVKLRGIVDDLKDAASVAFTDRTLPNLSAANLPGVQATRQGASITIDPKVAELPGLTEANLAAMRYAESQQYATELLAYDYQKLRAGLSQFGIQLQNVGTRMQGFILTLADGLSQFLDNLISKIGGSGKNAQNGRGIGGLIGTAGGWLLGGPVGAWLGNKVGTAAGGFIGGMFDHAKVATTKASDAMDRLAKTVEKVNASITNVPAWYKVQTARFMAAPILPPAPAPTPTTPYPGPNPNPGPIQPPGGHPGTPPGGSNPRTPDPSANVIHIENLHLPNVQNVTDFMRELRQTSLKARNRGGSARFAMAGGGPSF